MTAPYIPYRDYNQQLGTQSPIAQQEWELFMQRRKELIDAIMGTSMSIANQQIAARQQSQASQGHGATRSWGDDGVNTMGQPLVPPARPAAEDELIGQARFWGIQNPESIPPQELFQMIQARRAEAPADSFDAGSGALSAFGFAAEASGQTARVIGNLFGGVETLPFAGPALASILGTDRAQQWLYDLSKTTSEFVEGVRSTVPIEGRMPFEIAMATGKVTGYALPGLAAWNAVGAVGGVVPAAWASRVASPFARAAMQGGISGAILEAGSPESMESKVFNIGLGTVLGGAAVSRFGASLGLGAVGAGIGGQVGETPGERAKHAAQGAVIGLVAGMVPMFAIASRKVNQDMPGPMDQAVDEAMKLRTGQMSQPATATLAEPPMLPSGPDFTVQMDAPPQLQVRGDQAIAGVSESGLPPLPKGIGPDEIPTNIRRREGDSVVDLSPGQLQPPMRNAADMEIFLGSRRLPPGPEVPPPAPTPREPSPMVNELGIEALDLNAAAAQGDVITKQAIILESPTLPQAVARTKVSDFDIIEAAQTTNPAGLTVVRSLGDPVELLQMAAENIHFVKRGGVFDALVGPATPDQVKSYEKFGVFSGQRVVGSGGMEGEVLGVSDGLISVRGPAGTPMQLRPEDVLPGRDSFPVVAAPDMWDAFQADLMNYANEQSAAAGMQPVLSIVDGRIPSMIQSRVSDFLDNLGIAEPAVRQVIEMDFNHRWTQTLKTLDPEMMVLQDDVMRAATEANNETVVSDSHHIVSSLEEKAEKRGFIWVSQAGEGGVLKDATNPSAPDIPLATDQAAAEFLARTDRTLPDLTPISDTPMEVAGMLPSEQTLDPRLAVEDYSDSIANSVDALTREVVGGGGAGEPPLPPGGNGQGPSEFGPPQLPPGNRTSLGAQFDRMRRSDPEKMHKLIHDFQGLMSSRLRYTRYATLKLEQQLYDSGVDLGKAWQHYEALDTGRARAFNEGQPWIAEWGDITRQFPRRTLRDGSVTRIHEIEDPNARMAAWWRMQETHGLSDRDIKKATVADERITNFMQRFFQFLTDDPAFAISAEREIFRYMPHVRARQAQGVKDAFDTQFLSPEVQFFGEFAREGNMQFRVMDARELGTHMVRSAMFKKHEAQAWGELVNAWDDPRIPESMRNYMLDFAKLTRYGYDPRGEIAVRGVQSGMEKMLGLKLTSREAAHLLNVPTGLMYMSMLAGRMSIFFRDAIQPLLALAKVEVPYMRGVYSDVMLGAGQKLTRTQEQRLVEMYDRGLKGGWIERENPNIEAAGIFEEQAGVRDNELMRLSVEEVQHRETAARVGDALYQLPAWIVRPSESSISTLKWYGRQGQLHRLITGEAAWRQATQSLQMYRESAIQAVINRDPSMAMPYRVFEDQSFFGSFEPAIRRKLEELVNVGADDQAADLFAREVANWSQFRYGRREMPEALRGNAGRIASMLGNFTGQFIEGMYSSLANGSPRHKVRYGMTVGAVSGLMYYLKHKTGWSFDKWAWVPNAFEFTGGPMLEKVATAYSGTSGIVAAANEYPVSDMQAAAMKDMANGPDMRDFFPYIGYVRSGAEYMGAAQGINPIEQSLRYTVTGDRGSGIDIERLINGYTGQQPQPPAGLGSQSPNGGLMPGNGGNGNPYNMPRQQYQFPQGNPHPGSGTQQ